MSICLATKYSRNICSIPDRPWMTVSSVIDSSLASLEMRSMLRKLSSNARTHRTLLLSMSVSFHRRYPSKFFSHPIAFSRDIVPLNNPSGRSALSSMLALGVVFTVASVAGCYCSLSGSVSSRSCSSSSDLTVIVLTITSST